MTEQISIPSRDPSIDDSIEGGIYIALRKFLQHKVDDMLPAMVVSYDRVANRACVQPLIQTVSTLGQITSRSQIASVPALVLGGGGFCINFALKPGDLGWIKANDRDISNFLQIYADATPNTGWFHDFSNGMFIPDVMKGYTIASGDAGNMVIQSLDGSVKISLGAIAITVEAPTVNIIGTTVNITSTGGTSHVTGSLNVSGTVTAATDAVIGGKSFLGHKHGGVQTGAGQTGVPV